MKSLRISIVIAVIWVTICLAVSLILNEGDYSYTRSDSNPPVWSDDMENLSIGISSGVSVPKSLIGCIALDVISYDVSKTHPSIPRDELGFISMDRFVYGIDRKIPIRINGSDAYSLNLVSMEYGLCSRYPSTPFSDTQPISLEQTVFQLDQRVPIPSSKEPSTPMGMESWSIDLERLGKELGITNVEFRGAAWGNNLGAGNIVEMTFEMEGLHDPGLLSRIVVVMNVGGSKILNVSYDCVRRSLNVSGSVHVLSVRIYVSSVHVALSMIVPWNVSGSGSVAISVYDRLGRYVGTVQQINIVNETKVSIDVPRTVYRAGERIPLTIRTTYDGSPSIPVANETVYVYLNDALAAVVTTNSSGIAYTTLRAPSTPGTYVIRAISIHGRGSGSTLNIIVVPYQGQAPSTGGASTGFGGYAETMATYVLEALLIVGITMLIVYIALRRCTKPA